MPGLGAAEQASAAPDSPVGKKGGVNVRKRFTDDGSYEDGFGLSTN
jgi:hypothetical protein